VEWGCKDVILSVQYPVSPLPSDINSNLAALDAQHPFFRMPNAQHNAHSRVQMHGVPSVAVFRCVCVCVCVCAYMRVSVDVQNTDARMCMYVYIPEKCCYQT
jgi:hypothetical protein